jgi:hypothetical protein
MFRVGVDTDVGLGDGCGSHCIVCRWEGEKKIVNKRLNGRKQPL